MGSKWCSVGQMDTFIVDPEEIGYNQSLLVMLLRFLQDLRFSSTSVTGYAEESDDDKDIDDGVSQENIFTW